MNVDILKKLKKMAKKKVDVKPHSEENTFRFVFWCFEETTEGGDVRWLQVFNLLADTYEEAYNKARQLGDFNYIMLKEVVEFTPEDRLK